MFILFAWFQVYKGYSDDPRNTDNAWIETLAVNYHDEDGTILQHFQLRVAILFSLYKRTHH